MRHGLERWGGRRRPIAEVLLLAAASTRSVARMARFSVRSGSLAFARLYGKACKRSFERTGANGRERSHALPCKGRGFESHHPLLISADAVRVVLAVNGHRSVARFTRRDVGARRLPRLGGSCEARDVPGDCPIHAVSPVARSFDFRMVERGRFRRSPATYSLAVSSTAARCTSVGLMLLGGLAGDAPHELRAGDGCA
jgi:hypothetical protein